ncbi:unnamed protein product, partial [Ectocarpus sp. 8 AP-2014]
AGGLGVEERDQITVPNVDGCLAPKSAKKGRDLNRVGGIAASLVCIRVLGSQQQLAIGAGACAGQTRPFSVLGSWLPDRPAVRGDRLLFRGVQSGSSLAICRCCGFCFARACRRWLTTRPRMYTGERRCCVVLAPLLLLLFEVRGRFDPAFSLCAVSPTSLRTRPAGFSRAPNKP